MSMHTVHAGGYLEREKEGEGEGEGERKGGGEGRGRKGVGGEGRGRGAWDEREGGREGGREGVRKRRDGPTATEGGRRVACYPQFTAKVRPSWC